MLAQRGIQQLYSHQAEAFRLAAAGRNVTVVTPTASGKTLCYNLPVLQRIATNPDARALYLYPTKALTYDQLDDLMAWANALERTSAFIPTTAIRRRTPAPQSGRKATSFSPIRTCCTRESFHTTRSGRGSLRTCLTSSWTNSTRIVAFSAAMWRMSSAASRASASFMAAVRSSSAHRQRLPTRRNSPNTLRAKPFELIAESGAGSAEKHVFFYNPPVVNRQLGIRRSYVNEAKQIAAAFLKRNIPAIVFANSRLITEILVRYLKAAVETGPAPQETVVGLSRRLSAQ